MRANPCCPMSSKRVISVVERGWRGARECAAVLNQAGVPVTHLIKGWISRDVQEMIGSTPKQRVVAWPRPAFYVGLWLWLAPRVLFGRVRWVLVDHERTSRGLARWAGWRGVWPVMIQEGERGFTLWRNGVRVSLEELLAPVAR